MKTQHFSVFLVSIFSVGLGLSGTVFAAQDQCVGLYGRNRSDFNRNAQAYHRQWHAMHHPSQSGYSAAHEALHRLMQSRRRMFRPSLVPKDCLVTVVSSSSRSSSSYMSSSVSSLSSSSLGNSSQTSSSSVSLSSSSAANTNQSPAALGAASTYAVLAGSTVTNTGQTTVRGDVGVSAGSSVTGFPPGVVNAGAIHSADMHASLAQSALTVAYNDLAGRSTNAVSVSGNLGGSTLSPGLYKSTSGLEISSGDLTLDAKGDTNAVFIFQMATTLNVTVGRHVMLIGGARASNIFWQVGTSATIGVNSTFKGSVLADQSISLQTGATVDGRLLARIGGVTLQSNTVTIPSN